jgi:hypothetical protein
MSDVAKPSSAAAQVAARPCRHCGGHEYAHFPDLGFEHASGPVTHHFEVLVCRQCHLADFFAELPIMERSYEHQILRAPVGPPYR